MSKIDQVIWDGDNTIWNWMGYAVPAYEAMCQEIARIAEKSFNETATAMKNHYSAAGTLEDEGLVQGLEAAGFFEDVTNFDMEYTIRQAQAVFSKVRRENLHVYPGIAAVMKEINERGIRQIMLTDAPGGQASARLKHSRLGRYIETIFAMPTSEIDLLEGFKSHYVGEGPKIMVVEEEKPHTDLKILGLSEEIANRIMMVGDNYGKDMALAKKHGWVGIHAAYGASSEDMISRIRRFAPDRVAARSSSTNDENSATSQVIPVYDPREILSYV